MAQILYGSLSFYAVAHPPQGDSQQPRGGETTAFQKDLRFNCFVVLID